MRSKPFNITLLTLLGILALIIPALSADFDNHIAGSVKDGYRILAIQPEKGEQNYTVFRGDYIKFRLPGDIREAEAEFPSLNEKKTITQDLEMTPFFKMKKAGIYPFILDSLEGRIRVIEYAQVNYRELTAQTADNFIKTHNPLILDVRTKGEYKSGHLENAKLLPVQELQKRMGELKEYKNETLLIYCDTGNRSTVASKILIDAGFTEILNLRYGIKDWAGKKYKIVK